MPNVQICRQSWWRILQGPIWPKWGRLRSKHTESETKWPPFCRWYFQIAFLEGKLLHFIDFFPSGINKKPKRRHASIRANDDLVCWRIYASPSLDELNQRCSSKQLNATLYKHLGPVSISNKTSYRKILRSLAVARFVFRIVRSLWNLTVTSVVMLPKGLPNFKAMR